jgi:aminoglycoside phosphotransferase (APT) family kinase protein
MESKTKSEFSLETIEQIIKSKFGDRAKIAQISPLTAGWFNTAYEIEFSDEHPAAVLRIAPDPNQRLLTYEKEMMRKELQVYEIFQQAGTIPVPRLLAYDTNRAIINRDFMFVEKYAGIPLEQIKDQLSPASLKIIYHQIGVITAELHTLRNDTFGYIGGGPGCGAKTWREAFHTFVNTLLNDGEELGVKLPLPSETIWEMVEQHLPLLDEIKEPTLVHWDLWPVNIFVVEKNGHFEVEGIIDWERAYWGDPESEPAIAIQHYGDPFFQGYERALTQGRSAAIRHKMYLIYLLLVMKIEAKVRFEDADHLSWVQAELTKELKLLEEF